MISEEDSTSIVISASFHCCSLLVQRANALTTQLMICASLGPCGTAPPCTFMTMYFKTLPQLTSEVCGSCCTEYCRRLEDDMLWTHVIRGFWARQRTSYPLSSFWLINHLKVCAELDAAGLWLYRDETRLCQPR